jgi:hypothetical protein
VARYDGAHGFAHRDLLDREGRVVDKRAIPGGPTYGEALQIGRQDFTANWRRYRDAFIQAAR